MVFGRGRTGCKRDSEVAVHGYGDSITQSASGIAFDQHRLGVGQEGLGAVIELQGLGSADRLETADVVGGVGVGIELLLEELQFLSAEVPLHHLQASGVLEPACQLVCGTELHQGITAAALVVGEDHWAVPAWVVDEDAGTGRAQTAARSVGELAPMVQSERHCSRNWRCSWDITS